MRTGRSRIDALEVERDEGADLELLLDDAVLVRALVEVVCATSRSVRMALQYSRRACRVTPPLSPRQEGIETHII